MTRDPRHRDALFLAEGTSDAPLAGLVEGLFLTHGITLTVTSPDYSLLSDKVRRDLASKLTAGRSLMGRDIDLVVMHRDVDTMDVAARRAEMVQALTATHMDCHLLPVIPVRMTEAWLLLDEAAIRRVAGNPNGRRRLDLPTALEAERLADPKARLRQVILDAAEVTGRRRDRLTRRFDNNRRQLLEQLDPRGEVSQLRSFERLLEDVQLLAARFTG